MENHFRKFSWSENIASLSTSLVTTSPHSHKSEKLQAIKDRQQANYQLLIMSNRIAKLIKDKELAEKEIFLAKQKTRQTKNQIKEKNNSANEYMNYKLETKEFEDLTRKKCQKEREERKKNIRDYENKILKKKKKVVRHTRNKSKEIDEEILANKSQDIEEKRKQSKKIKSRYVESLRQRCLTQRSERSRFSENYFNSIERQKNIQNNALEKVQQLEILESELIQKLSKTLETRNHLIENLNKIKSS